MTMRTLVVVVALVSALPGCGRISRDVRLLNDPSARIEELWQDPGDIGKRDLFQGPGTPGLMPKDSTFEFVAVDAGGYSPGFDVKSADGMEWSVKTGPEAQTEVVASRILWAIGFHQPPTYYLDKWTMTGAVAGVQEPARFRPSLPGKVVGDWSWYENPFVGTRPFGGLIVANLIINSWDWKTSNNKIYELPEPVNGVRRMFVVRDLGASFGRTSYPKILKWFRLRGFGQGSRNDLPGFEAQGFIKDVDNEGELEFDYRGIYRDVIHSATLEDVRWACERLSRLTDRQWQDAFRAGGYNAEQTQRYVAKIKSKIAQGLSIKAPAS